MRQGRRSPVRALLAFVFLLGLVGGAVLVAAGLRPAAPQAAPLPSATFARGSAGPVQSGASAAAVTPAFEVARELGAHRLAIPRLDVEAPVEDRPLRRDGDLVVPGDPGVVARWHGAGSAWGATGTTVLAGHVDVSGDLGALHDLHSLRAGDEIVTTDGGGHPTVWHVDGMQVGTCQGVWDI